MKDDISVLLGGEHIIPASIDDAAEWYDKRINFINSILLNVEEEHITFWKHVKDPFIDVNVFYDQENGGYIMEYVPVVGEAYQRALNETLGIPGGEE